MAKKKFFIKTDEKDAKKKALEQFDTEENRIISEDVLGGFRQYGGKHINMDDSSEDKKD